MNTPAASVSLGLLVIRAADVARTLSFYCALGLDFVEEKHGSGPTHFIMKKSSRTSFPGIAAGSGGELETQILLTERLDYLDRKRAQDLLEHYREEEHMLAGLTRSLERR